MSSPQTPPPILIGPATRPGDQLQPSSDSSAGERLQSPLVESPLADRTTFQFRSPAEEQASSQLPSQFPSQFPSQDESRQGITQSNPDLGNTRATNVRLSPPSSLERLDGEVATLSGLPTLPHNQGMPSNVIPQALPPARFPSTTSHGALRRPRTADTYVSNGHRSGIDWIVPVDEKTREHTVGDRLEPTLKVARAERDKYEMRAKYTGYALNIAIGLQVLLGSLTTGLSAAAASGKSSKAVQTTILGGLSTLVASYLARARGSNEPEQSNTKVKALSQFIREAEAFTLDHGHVVGDSMNRELDRYRKRFEELLGNTTEDRHRPSPVVDSKSSEKDS